MFIWQVIGMHRNCTPTWQWQMQSGYHLQRVRDMKGNTTREIILVKHLPNDIHFGLHGLLRTKGCSTNEHRALLLTSRSATAPQAISVRREVQSVIRPPLVVFS